MLLKLLLELKVAGIGILYIGRYGKILHPCSAVLTRDFSSSRVIMTTEAARCSQTILQKSPNVSAKGPWVAM